ncbi:hypothetical protein [Actinoplanes derwentensis]|uniref:Uncharacterized protein n=1 Tax=Actinoplanes derwentensis TaxID=113562 RepID=A0A1H2CUQ1_9ACTN|nr:hypothetical protein [Actinoplanes derwentensis]GID81976.1 hypothetical protein Ade03nite_09000 [Actinoplanes derwentensis]SDT74258.1 hypothetical protein SAMN04489716_6925 [Actinoplanes derwentensis]
MDKLTVVGLYVAVAVLAAVVVGAVAGWLSWLDDSRLARAVLVGGSASGAALGLAVAVAALIA